MFNPIYLNLKSQCSKLNEIVESTHLRVCRSEVFHLIGKIYKRSVQDDAGLNKKYFPDGLCDHFLITAEEVLTEAQFGDFPGSLLRLKPLAEEYSSQWQQLFKAVQILSDTDLGNEYFNCRIDAFVTAHQLFSEQYIQEIKECGQGSHLNTRLCLPESLKFFYCITVDFLEHYPDFASELKQMILDSDEKVFLILPHLCLLRMLQMNAGCYPELFKSFQSNIADLASSFAKLKEEEKDLMLASLFLSETSLPSTANDLQLKIRQLAYALHSGELARPFADCFKTLYEDLSCDFVIAEQLKAELKAVQIDREQPQAHQLLSALLELSPASLKLLYPFVPGLQASNCYLEKLFNAEIPLKEKIHSFLQLLVPFEDDSYRNNMKNRDFGKEVSPNSDSEIHPLQPKTDSSCCFGRELHRIRKLLSSLPEEPHYYRLYAILLLATKN